MTGAAITLSSVGPSRVRVSAPDPFVGLRGKEYLAARGITSRITFKGQPTLIDGCQCQTCIREEMLPAVLRICAAYDRRQPVLPARINWDIDSEDALQALTDRPETVSA